VSSVERTSISIEMKHIYCVWSESEFQPTKTHLQNQCALQHKQLITNTLHPKTISIRITHPGYIQCRFIIHSYNLQIKIIIHILIPTVS